MVNEAAKPVYNVNAAVGSRLTGRSKQVSGQSLQAWHLLAAGKIAIGLRTTVDQDGDISLHSAFP